MLERRGARPPRGGAVDNRSQVANLPRFTRRALCRWLGGTAILAALRGNAQSSTALSWHETVHPGTNLERRYRADAQVVILSIPLLHRAGVGGGSVVWREAAEANGDTLRLLEFFGHSNPEHAAGLNRLGFIRELMRISGNRVEEALYFGLMTSSPEESAEDARKALHPTAADVTYSVIEGRVSPGDATTAKAHFLASSKLSSSQRVELEALGRKALDATKATPAEFDTRGAIPAPFLEAMAELLAAPQRSEGRYVYGGRLYHLWVRRSADAKATAYYRQRRMAAGNVIRVAGKLRRETGGKEWEFRLWVEEGAAQPLPLRIEYQAKSYLRLTFESES